MMISGEDGVSKPKTGRFQSEKKVMAMSALQP